MSPRLRKSPLDGHPRAAETRRAMVVARIDDEVEVADLQASELACDVADAWAGAERTFDLQLVPGVSRRLAKALDRLELVTRPSAMRKVVRS